MLKTLKLWFIISFLPLLNILQKVSCTTIAPSPRYVMGTQKGDNPHFFRPLPVKPEGTKGFHRVRLSVRPLMFSGLFLHMLQGKSMKVGI